MARYASCIFGFVSAHNRSVPDTCIPRRTSPQPPLCPPHGGLDAILIPGCLIVSFQLMAYYGETHQFPIRCPDFFDGCVRRQTENCVRIVG